MTMTVAPTATVTSIQRVGSDMLFPLPADANYSYQQRYDASHRGTDILAPKGTPVLAVESGKVECRVEPKGGKVCYLETTHGKRYYYAHLDSYEFEKATVEAGDKLGAIGNTGNAAGRPPHLHFQISPGGRGTIQDPYPELAAADPKRSTGARGPTSVTKTASGGGLGLLLLLFLVLKKGKL